MTELSWIGVGAIVAILGALRAAFSPCGQSMLASLTPYAEAARGSRWTITATSFSVGAVVAGACGGLIWGGLGSLLPAGSWRLIAAAAVLAVALMIDATPLRRRLPLTKRQVNEDWMVTYRGWVYGVGFGAQLGLGFITLVACAAIYCAFAIEFLSGQRHRRNRDRRDLRRHQGRVTAARGSGARPPLAGVTAPAAARARTIQHWRGGRR